MTHTLLKLTLFTTFLILTSCASRVKQVYTMDDQERPSWASEATSFLDNGDYYSFIGTYSIQASSSLNLNMVRKASEMKAWEELSKHITGEFNSSSALKSSGLFAEEEIEQRSKFKTQALVHKARVQGRWYQIVKKESETGDYFEIQYYTKLTIKRKDLNAVLASI